MSKPLALVCPVSLSVFLPLLVYGCIHLYKDMSRGEPSGFLPAHSCVGLGIYLSIQYGFVLSTHAWA